MLRLLLLAALIYLLFKGYRYLRRPRHAPNEQRTVTAIRCAHCGLHLPASEAVRAADASPHYYCTPAHAHLGPKPPRRS